MAGHTVGGFFRALTMLGFLVAIPVLALSGFSLPRALAWVLEGQWAPPTSENRPADEAPKFLPVPDTSVNPAAPVEQRIPDRSSPTKTPAEWPVGAFEPGRASVTPASYEAMPPGRATIDASPGTLIEIGRPAGREPSLGTRFAHPRAAEFDAMEKRLRTLGAAYFRLESWGDQQQLYRFYCKVAIAGSPHCTRHFEATDADPLAAMAHVVRQIEAKR